LSPGALDGLNEEAQLIVSVLI